MTRKIDLYILRQILMFSSLFRSVSNTLREEMLLGKEFDGFSGTKFWLEAPSVAVVKNYHKSELNFAEEEKE